MTTKQKRLPRTTVGRFWGYTGILIALSVSLAGNVAAAYLHDRTPTWVDLGFAGLAPLSAFISIEIVNHNPWADETWGRAVKWVLLAVVAPAAAVVSFIHLMTVVISGRVHDSSPEGVLTWITAALTALLIDGLMFGGTAALLIKPLATRRDWEGDLTAEQAKVAELETLLEAQAALLEAATTVKSPARAPRKPKPPVVIGTLGAQEAPEERDRKRWPPREHPLWDDFVAAKATGPWTPADLQLEMKRRMNREISLPAATMQLVRWEKEYSQPAA